MGAVAGVAVGVVVDVFSLLPRTNRFPSLFLAAFWYTFVDQLMAHQLLLHSTKQPDESADETPEQPETGECN